jgi:hypothetical protein
MTADKTASATPVQTARWLVTIFVALARRSGESLDRAYRRAIRDMVVERTGGLVAPDEVDTLISESVSDHTNGESKRVLGEAVRELGMHFEPDGLRDFLHDLVSLALHDDWYAHEEGRFISAVARRWNVHPADDERVRLWSVMDAEASGDTWTAVNDLALVYIALAHQSDDDLSQKELDAIARKLAEWLPAAIPGDVGAIVGDALRTYADGDEVELVREAVARLKVAVPPHQRAAIFSDLEYIARADDVMLVEERAIIAELADAWGMKVAGL